MITPEYLIRKPSITPEELVVDRARIVEMYSAQGISIEKFTCDECGARFNCTLVFDAYNTDGDCLAEK